LHSYLGEYSQALQCLTDSLPLWRQIKRLSGEVLTLGTLAEVYSGLGDAQQAITYLQEAADKISEIENKEIKVDHHNKWGVVYLELGNHEEALKAYLKAADVVEGTTLRYYALVQNQLGLSRTYLAKGSQKDLAEARDYATQAITLSQEMQLAGNEPLAHAYLGKANLLLGNKETALQNCREALHLLQKQKVVHGSEAEIYLHAFHILTANGPRHSAQECLKRAYKLVQATTKKILDETLRQRYLAMPVNREISAA
jgi:tetratricopeptide (TPR) repeat protein